MATTVPTVNPITATPPERSQGQDEFNSNAADYLVQQKTFSTEVNAMVPALNTAVGEAETAVTNAESAAADALGHANDAQTSADASAGTANYQGEWSAATGAASVGQSYSYQSQIWAVKQAIADITLSQPAENADWIRISQPITGTVEVVAGEALSAGRSVRIGADGKAYNITDNNPFPFKIAGKFAGAESKGLADSRPAVANDGNSTYVFAYLDAETLDYYVRAATLDEYDELTFGTKVVFETGALQGGGPQIVYDSINDAFVVIYSDDNDNDYLKYCVVTVLGTTLTVNASAQVGTNQILEQGESVNYKALFEPNAGSIVVVYNADGATNTLAIAGQVSGTTVTWGSTVDSGINGGPDVDIASNAAGNIAATFMNSLVLYAWPMTVSGTTLSTTAPTSLNSSMGGLTNSIFHHGPSDYFCIINEDSNSLRLFVFSLSGTTLTQAYNNQVMTDNDYSSHNLRVYSDPTSGATILLTTGSGIANSNMLRFSMTEGLGFNLTTRKNYLGFQSNTSAGAGFGCIMPNGKLMQPQSDGSAIIINFQAAEYNHGFTNFQEIPISVASIGAITFAMNTEGTGIVAAVGSRLMGGTIDPATKTITWGTQKTATITGNRSALVYNEQEDIFVQAYFDSSTSISARTITLSGTTATVNTPLALSTNVITTAGDHIGLGYDKSSGMMHIAGRVDTSLDGCLISFCVDEGTTNLVKKDELTFGATQGRFNFQWCSFANKLALGHSGTTSHFVFFVVPREDSFYGLETIASNTTANPCTYCFVEDYLFVLQSNSIYPYQVNITGGANAIGAEGLHSAYEIDSTADADSTSVMYFDPYDKSFYVFNQQGNSAFEQNTGHKMKLFRTADNFTYQMQDTGITSVPYFNTDPLELTWSIQTPYGLVVAFNNKNGATGNVDWEYQIGFFENRGYDVDNYIGFTQNAASATETVNITTRNFKNSQMSGLTVGKQYLQRNGKLTDKPETTALDRPVGVALSATELLLSSDVERAI